MRNAILFTTLMRLLVPWPGLVWANELDNATRANNLDQQTMAPIMQTLMDCSPPDLRQPLASVQLLIEPSEDIFAYSTKGRIVISRGLLIHFKDKDFLHFVVAHEFSHHMLSHLDRSRRMFPGEIFEETVAASLRQYFEFELEADLMAVQTLKQCSIDTSRLGEHLEKLIASTRESAEIPELLQFHQRRINKLRSIPSD